MARPKKQPLERRTERCDIRVTLAEKTHVEAQAAAAGIGVGEYVRRRAVGYTVPSGSSRRVDPALVTELNRLGLQLSGLGNVVNQVARAVHTDRRLPADFELLPAEIRSLQSRVSAALDQVLSDASVTSGVELQGDAEPSGDTANEPLDAKIEALFA